MADADLPVFSFRANWREPMQERLGFLTDVLAASEGAEQRRSVRQTPRRSYSADFLLTHNERTFWDLFIDALGGGEVVAPLYWETVTIPATLTATVSDRIDFDTSNREWEYHAGYLALLIRDSALDYEVVEIAAVDSGGVDLADPVAASWPKGTKLLPLRRAVLDQIGDVDHPSAAVATVSAEIRIVGPNPRTPAADASPTYGGLPVFLSEPNWVEGLSVSQDREIDLLDTDVGLTYQVDATGRVLLGQSHRWFLPGREKLAEFRDLIYRHKGRAGVFWLPTFKADLRLAEAAGSADTEIEVENVGYGYTGGPSSGREYIAIKHTGGTILRKVLTVSAGSTNATETLGLDAALGLDLSPGQVLRISFADTARFDTDEFEITHFGGVDAHHESAALFRTFKNTRTSPTPIHYPKEIDTENSDACGDIPFYVKFRVEWLVASTAQPNGGFYINPEVGPAVDNTDNNTALDHAVVVPFEYIEFTYLINNVPEDQEIDLRLQFSSGSVASDMRARMKILRFGDSDYTVLSPKAGSHSLADGDGWFDVRGLWPDNWFFDI